MQCILQLICCFLSHAISFHIKLCTKFYRVKRMGLVLDAGIEDELRIRQLQVADAARASLGLPVVEYIVTDIPLKVSSIILF